MAQLACEIITLLTIVLGLVLILGCAIGPAISALRPFKNTDKLSNHDLSPQILKTAPYAGLTSRPDSP